MQPRWRLSRGFVKGGRAEIVEKIDEWGEQVFFLKVDAFGIISYR